MTPSLRHRRPKGYPIKQFRPVLKQHVVEALAKKGMKLDVIRKAGGISPHTRMYVASGRGEEICLDVVSRGSKPDWTKMLNTVEVTV